MDFASDNTAGAAPEILKALTAANRGTAAPYADDDLTARVERRLAELFERDVAVFLLATGSAANGLALATLTPPYGAVLCHEASHIQRDECAGPEFFSGGAKLMPLPGTEGKLSPGTVRETIGLMPPGIVHFAQISTLSLTQATEAGTVYTPQEIAALAEAAHEYGLAVHMDGARFANAVAHLGCSPAELTWQAGVDVLVFGATKNGALAAEAVIFFDPARARDFALRRKRAGHLLSKSRFLAAQWDAYLENSLWLQLAQKANGAAQMLAEGLGGLPGVRFHWPPQANEVFAELPRGALDALQRAGARFHPWIVPGDPSGGRMIRLVTSFATQQDEVLKFLDIVRLHTKKAVT